MDGVFRQGQRVKVNESGPAELVGKTGVVFRVLIRSSYEAWVQMDDPIPKSLASFSKGDSRRDHVLLEADDCDPVTTTP